MIMGIEVKVMWECTGGEYYCGIYQKGDLQGNEYLTPDAIERAENNPDVEVKW